MSYILLSGQLLMSVIWGEIYLKYRMLKLYLYLP